MLNTTHWLALGSAVLAAGCGDPTPAAAPMVAPMDLRLGVPLHSREVPLRLSQLTGPDKSLAACLSDEQIPYNTRLRQITLCDKGLLTIVFTDILQDGTYTLSGNSLHATLHGGSAESAVPSSFDGILAEDGSFVSTQLSPGVPFQNYERSAEDQKSLEEECDWLYRVVKLSAAAPSRPDRLPIAE